MNTGAYLVLHVSHELRRVRGRVAPCVVPTGLAVYSEPHPTTARPGESSHVLAYVRGPFDSAARFARAALVPRFERALARVGPRVLTSGAVDALAGHLSELALGAA